MGETSWRCITCGTEEQCTTSDTPCHHPDRPVCLCLAAFALPTWTNTPLALSRNRAMGSLVWYPSAICCWDSPRFAARSRIGRGRSRQPPSQSASSSCSMSQVTKDIEPTFSIVRSVCCRTMWASSCAWLLRVRPSAWRGLKTTTRRPSRRRSVAAEKASSWRCWSSSSRSIGTNWAADTMSTPSPPARASSGTGSLSSHPRRSRAPRRSVRPRS